MSDEVMPGQGDENDEDDNVRSIRDGAGDDPPEELFPLGSLPGDGLALKQLIRGNLPVEVTTSIMAAEVPSPGGLFDPANESQVLVTYEVAHYVPVPVREGPKGQRKITKWKIRQVLRPVYVQPVTAQVAAAFADAEREAAAS